MCIHLLQCLKLTQNAKERQGYKLKHLGKDSQGGHGICKVLKIQQNLFMGLLIFRGEVTSDISKPDVWCLSPWFLPKGGGEKKKISSEVNLKKYIRLITVVAPVLKYHLKPK